MRTCVFFCLAAAAILLLASGCGEGPVFPEDKSVLAAGGPEPEKEVTRDTSSVSEDMRKFDPELRKLDKEQEQKQEEVKQAEEQKQTDDRDAVEALNDIGGLINDSNFDEAGKVFDQNAAAIRQLADEGMADSNPKIAELYKDFWENLKKMRDILDRDDLSEEAKRTQALNAFSAAGDSKRAAGQLKIYE
jgi:hypothetical protein